MKCIRNLQENNVIMMPINLAFILIGLNAVQSLTCDEVLNMPSNKQISLEELSSLSPKDVSDCLPHISRAPMSAANANFIWKTLIDFYEGIPNIPENILSQLRWVTVAIQPEEYANVTIASIETVKNFGLPYNLHLSQLEAIAERVRQDFAGKSPEDYTYYDLKALNQILCAFNRSEIERIHPIAYRESASFIGKLKNCNEDVMTGFANLAIQKDAFGPLEKWTGLILKTVGSVAEYLRGGIPKELLKKLEAEEEKIDEPEDFHDNWKSYSITLN